MGKILCYIYNEMAEFEVTVVLQRLKNLGGRTIVTVGDTHESVYSQSGLRVLPDLSVDEVTDISEYEALIIPGGPIRNEQNAICPIIRKMAEAGKLVACICFAPQFLGRAGILNDHQYTTSCDETKIASLGCADPFPRENYVEARVVKDGNILTAKGYAFVDFAEAICDELGILENEKQRYDLFRIIKEQ